MMLLRRSRHLPRTSLATAVLAMLSFDTTASAQPQSDPGPSPATTAEVDWAIALHGGAGGDPATWSEEKRQARRRGLETALRLGRELLERGDSAVDTVEAVIRSLEDNAAFNAGRGSVVTTAGEAELDASIMDGRNHACGAVAGVETIKNPISAARLVMTDTQHVLLIGRGAEAFAAEKDLPQVDPDYFLSRRERAAAGEDDHPHLGTVGCVARDRDGHLAAGTSTGGTKQKLPGRVGDSPLIGAGTYADDATCAVSGTGVGEEYIRHAVAYDVSAQMKYAGRSLTEAATEIMTQRLEPGIGGLIGLTRDGQLALQHNTPGMSCGAADSRGRFQIFLKLENGGRADPPAPSSSR
jgi:beta-aspartyl-peptidase (threonine type)